MKTLKGKTVLFIGLVFFLSLPLFASAVSLGQKEIFFIEPSYDLQKRENVSATLLKMGQKAYFFVDDNYFNSLTNSEKKQLDISLENLDNEFSSKIYPVLTSSYGSEWMPGIDNDSRVTILFHLMPEEAGGYFRSVDEYEKIQIPNSNQREMIYLNATYANSSRMKSLIAHEFTHLITFYQKNKKLEIEEDVWLNEARAEYAPTLLGYDNIYQGSNLERRIKQFLDKPNDSITEWQGLPTDYGVLNLFIQYLVEQYGLEILTGSMQLESVGIESINEALTKKGFKEDFAQVFTDWTITILVNDCSLGKKYCYKNTNLKSLRITPSINFLPLLGESTLKVNQTTKNWSGSWFKFIGGNKALKIEFTGNPGSLFKIPYLLMDVSGKYSLNFFQLDEYQRGEILTPKFGTEISSVTIIPTLQSKTSEFSNPEPAFPFFWGVSTVTEEKTRQSIALLNKPISEMSKDEILLKISELEELLKQLRNQLDELNKQDSNNVSCQSFQEHLSYGLRNNDEVRYLQEFLKNQGSEIYPEGLVTGNFLSLTKAAVIRFQEKYKEEILSPLGLSKGTGYVGPMTIKKINQICSSLTLR